MLLRLTFAVEPKGKQRARTSFQDSQGRLLEKPRTFTPEATRDLEQQIRMLAIGRLNQLGLPKPMIPARSPVFLVTTYSLRRPKTGVYSTLLYPTSKPDLSNMTKLLEDALNGVVWSDDSQIVENLERKQWSPTGKPRIELLVADLEEMSGRYPNVAALAHRGTSSSSGDGCASSPANRLSTRTMSRPAVQVAGMSLATSALSLAGSMTAATPAS